MRRWIVCLVAGVLALPLVASAAAPSTTQSTTEPTIDPATASLVKQLGADDWRQRESAQKQLVAMGQDATPALEQAVKDAPDDETRSRASAALEQIAQNRLIGASVITLHLKDVSPQAIFEAISAQCDTQLEPFTADLWQQKKWANIDQLDIDHQPFWAAMQQVSEVTGVELRQWDSGLRLMFNGAGGTGDMGPRLVSGPFLIIANRVARDQSVELSSRSSDHAGSRNNDFSVAFTVFAEPKLRVLRAGLNAHLDEATDDHGNSLVPDEQNEAANGGYSSGVGGMWAFRARLDFPKTNPGTRIASLKGSIPVSIQTGYETVEIPDVMNARNLTKSAGGVRVLFQEMHRNNGEQYEMNLTILADAGTSPEVWERIQQSVQSPDFRLRDEQGVALMRTSYSSSGSQERMEVRLVFVKSPWFNTAQRRTGEPSKLIWKIPTQSREVNVAFEFTDLPMP